MCICAWEGGESMTQKRDEKVVAEGVLPVLTAYAALLAASIAMVDQMIILVECDRRLTEMQIERLTRVPRRVGGHRQGGGDDQG
jgi:hypothetical protein